MGVETLLPLGVSVLSSLGKSSGGGGQSQVAPQAPMMPQMPFPLNIPDGGKKAPSMLDFYNVTGGSPNGMPDMGNMSGMQTQPQSVFDLINPASQSSPFGGGLLGMILKGFK